MLELSCTRLGSGYSIIIFLAFPDTAIGLYIPSSCYRQHFLVLATGLFTTFSIAYLYFLLLSSDLYVIYRNTPPKFCYCFLVLFIGLNTLSLPSQSYIIFVLLICASLLQVFHGKSCWSEYSITNLLIQCSLVFTIVFSVHYLLVFSSIHYWSVYAFIIIMLYLQPTRSVCIFYHSFILFIFQAISLIISPHFIQYFLFLAVSLRVAITQVSFVQGACVCVLGYVGVCVCVSMNWLHVHAPAYQIRIKTEQEWAICSLENVPATLDG